MRREKKEILICSVNPQWKIMNKEIFGEWQLPEKNLVHRKNK